MAEPADTSAATFESQRQRLLGVAYRMLGSIAEAEDAVQDAYLRWHEVDQTTVRNAQAFLTRMVSRICLDRLKSARVRRETYVGPWLPEPILDAEQLAVETTNEYATDLSVGLMLALERLSPLERAAFLLHDIFDVDFAEIAELIGRNEAACRQLAARARGHVRAARPRFTMPADGGESLVAAFNTAMQSGDLSALAKTLAEDAVLHSDGGGKRAAALNPIYGRDKIVRFLDGVTHKFPEPTFEIRMTRINGLPGLIFRFEDGAMQTMAFEIENDAIINIYVMRNPDKLAHLRG